MWFPGFWKVIAAVVRWAARSGNDSFATTVAGIYARVRPNDPFSWVVRAGAYRLLKKDNEAKEILSQGLERHPSDSALSSYFAHIVSATRSEGEFERARSLLLQGTREHPESSVPFIRLAELEYVDGDLPEATRYANLAYNLISADDDSGPLTTLGRILLDLGDFERASSTLELAMDRGSQPLPPILLGLLREGIDDELSGELFRKARKRWKSSRHSAEEFEEFVEGARRIMREKCSGQQRDPFI